MPPEIQTQVSSENIVSVITPETLKQIDFENDISSIPPDLQKDSLTENEISVEPVELEKQLSPEEEARAHRMAEVERRKAELRRRMEEASKARKAKKGFMTPERKKKLRLLLRKKAAEELKKEQERKTEERRWIIEDRCGDPDDLEWASKDDLIDICEDYFNRILECESEKWDLEHEIRKRAFEIAELNSKVNDLRGKFQKPILKKVSKYENKFAKLQRKAAEFNFRNQLKMVRRTDFLKDLEDKKDKSHGEKHVEKEDRPEIESEKEVEKIREEGEEAEETTLAEEDGEKVPQEIEGEILSEGAVLTEGEPHPEGEVPLEGEPHTEEELLLEGERPKDEEGQPVLEGEEGAGGQSPEEGEVQPAEPPPPPEPEHTEEDLWHYLKEAVTSVHPATVEEFVQNLIGTLQHVPDEYLRPVIDANIKRATSPSVTDGEHLPAESHLEGEEAVPVEGSPTSDSLPGAEGEIALSADDQSAPILDDTPAAEEESAVPTEELSSEVPEDHHLVDEDSADPNEGYSALEAAA